ncbi:MAG: hypothetical protein KL785_05890 [Brevundimonas sp.]|nr:hypothetical protein [Brevundimonas sp.]
MQARGAENRLIRPADVVDLAQSGIERFVLAPRVEPGFEIVVLYNGVPNAQRVRPEESLETVHARAMAAFGHPAGGARAVQRGRRGGAARPDRRPGRAGRRVPSRPAPPRRAGGLR